jgi:hypothetical protein
MARLDRAIFRHGFTMVEWSFERDGPVKPGHDDNEIEAQLSAEMALFRNAPIAAIVAGP